jgi:hypothetical protein
MIPTLSIFERGMTLLGADTATLAPAALALKVILVKAAFTPGPGLAIGDLTEADFTGYAAIAAALAALPESLDPATGDSLLTVGPPAGGFRWETTGTTTLNTIYGYALVDNGKATLYAADTFSTPIVLTATNQSIVLDPIGLRLLAGSII